VTNGPGEGSVQLGENFLQGKGNKKNPGLGENFLEELPAVEVPTKYIIFKPLKDLKVGEDAVVVAFVANPDQLSALVVLANYDRQGAENVFVPTGAGCHQISIYAFMEGSEGEA